MISVDRLTKIYGDRVAVWQVTFDVADGQILGFLGPNGAGKTTTMRMITGFIAPSSGTARVAGYDILDDPMGAKSQIGYLSETPPVYREMVLRSYLGFVADIKRTPRNLRAGRIDRALELCGLTEVAHRVIGHLSKGYRQRVGLAQAILHEPKVLILDEPTVGLDPRQIIEIRQLIRGLSGEQTVVLSTHILPEVQATCSRVVIINEGQVVAQDSIEAMTAGLGRVHSLSLRVARDADDLAVRLSALPEVTEATREGPGRYSIRVEGGDEASERIAAWAVTTGCGVLELSRQRASLEDVFLHLVTEEPAEAAS